LDYINNWYNDPETQKRLVNTLPERFSSDNVESEIKDKMNEISKVPYSFADLTSDTAGSYSPEGGIKINKNLLNTADERYNNAETTALHETIHSTALDKKYAKLAPKMKIGDLPTDEVYPRIMELRKSLGKKPGEEITKKDIEGLGFEGMVEGQKMNPSFLQDLLKEYDVEDILKMSNTWADNSNNNKKNKKKFTLSNLT